MPGTRPGVRLSWTLYLLRTLYTVLLLRTPLSFQISRIEYPLLYISTIFLSRSVLLILFLVIGILILCCRRIILSDDFRKTATSSGNAPNMANTSAASVVSGNNLLPVSILSWMEIIRTTLMRHSSINADSSRKTTHGIAEFWHHQFVASFKIRHQLFPSRSEPSRVRPILQPLVHTRTGASIPYPHQTHRRNSPRIYNRLLPYQYTIFMITSANIQVLFEYMNHTILKNENRTFFHVFIFTCFHW